MKKAFTILELLVVISVLTIIIGIGIPRVKGFMDNAKNAQARKELQTMQAALESYYTFSQSLPPSSATVSSSYLVNASPKVINTTLYDPLATGGTTEYNYIKSGNGKYYVTYSVGYNASASGVSISNAGVVNGLDNDDLCASNGNGCEPGALRCASGLYNCSGTCTDLQSEPNCGACGVTCTGGKGCCCGGCYFVHLCPC